MLKQWFRLVVAVCIVMSVVGFTAAQDSAPTLTIGINAEVGAFDPHSVPGSIIGNRIFHMMFDQLTRTDSQGLVQPMLATEWTQTDDTTWVFTLREGVTFHNGETMTAEDAAFSLNRLVFGEQESSIRTLYTPFIAGVEATGELELTITTVAPDPLLPLRLSTPYSAIMPQAYVEATNFEALQTAPIGAGPYRMTEFIAGDRIVLERHDNYWMGAPEAATVTIRLIPETSTRVAALQAGEVDLITTVSPDLVDVLDAENALRVDTVPVYNFMLIYFNTTMGITQDSLVRRALSLAIDREAIADALWGGRVRVMNDFFLPGEFGYGAERPIFPYDPEQAQALLAEAGYDGEELPFTPPSTYYTNGQLVTDAIAEMWEAVGINVAYEPLDTAAWADRSLGGQNIATLQSFGTSGDPATNSVVQTWNSWLGQYYTPSEEFNTLAAEAAQSLDNDVRLANYRRIAEILETDVPFTPLYQSVEFYAMRDGITWTPHQEFYIDLRPGAFNFGS
ncbi:MAG: ABC transporter substrate-binding protein [Chloroflexota bacterium]|nr:ABC transporter substrate-binding protein [Chloroflexota bacterium]